MTKQSERASFLPTHSLWMRIAAVVGLLLVLVASSAQASHVHGTWLPSPSFQVALQTDTVVGPADETSCPLCMAMHSAMPTGMQGRVGVLSVVGCLVSLLPERIAWRVFQFSLFSRPPPAPFLRGFIR